MNFYIDADKCEKYGIFAKYRVEVYLNGRLVKNAIAAKSGKFGFVKYCPEPVRAHYSGKINRWIKKHGKIRKKFTRNTDCLITRKIRGNVKISLSPKRSDG